MATGAKSKYRGGKPYRLTVRQFLAMIEQGLFPPEARIELLRGILVELPKRTTQHDYVVDGLAERMRKILPDSWFVREEKSLELGKMSRVRPDITLILGPRDLYRERGPGTEGVGLVIEVADSTYPYDRGVKWRAYASAMIPIYWIVNLPKRQIEVFRDPRGQGKAATYGDSTVFGPEAEVPVLLESREIGRIAVGEIIP